MENPELESIKSRLQEMEEETEKLKSMQDEYDKQMNVSPNEKSGNVDYSATADDVERHFHGCGSVNRVTILQNKFTGAPKGFAYVEFAEKESVQIAIALDDSSLKGRLIKVSPKRTNQPGLSMAPMRGGEFRGGRAGWRRPYRGRGRGFHRGYAPY